MSPKHQEEKTRNLRLEWISFVYLVLFALAVMAPSLVRHGYFGFKQESIEEFLIFCFGLVGVATFIGYDRIMEIRMSERDTAIMDGERAKKELIESYRYIGQVNRQIEMLKTLSNQTSMTLLEAESYRKDLLQSIVSNAAAVMGVPHALVRFIDVTRLRTESEISYAHTNGKDHPIKISNKDLRAFHEAQQPYAVMKTEDGHTTLIVGSDRVVSPVRAFLIFNLPEGTNVDTEVSLLKVFVNQAELVFSSLQRRRADGPTTPLQLVDAVTGSNAGEVS